jgi:cell wall-associated NlpC family hydrolase
MTSATAVRAEVISRSAIVAEARTWIGTPYRHQASLKGVGCDCLGLVRGVPGAPGNDGGSMNL